MGFSCRPPNHDQRNHPNPRGIHRAVAGRPTRNRKSHRRDTIATPARRISASDELRHDWLRGATQHFPRWIPLQPQIAAALHQPRLHQIAYRLASHGTLREQPAVGLVSERMAQIQHQEIRHGKRLRSIQKSRRCAVDTIVRTCQKNDGKRLDSNVSVAV